MSESILFNFMEQNDQNIESRISPSETNTEQSNETTKNRIGMFIKKLVGKLLLEVEDYDIKLEKEAKLSMFEAQKHSSLRDEYSNYLWTTRILYQKKQNKDTKDNFIKSKEVILKRLFLFFDETVEDKMDFLSPDLEIDRKKNDIRDFKDNLINNLRKKIFKEDIFKRSKISLVSIFPDNLVLKDDNLGLQSTEDESKISENKDEIVIEVDNYLVEVLSNELDFISTKHQSNQSYLSSQEKSKQIPNKLRQLIEYSLYIFSIKKKNLLFILANKESKMKNAKMKDKIEQCLNKYPETFQYLKEMYSKEKLKIYFLTITFQDKDFDQAYQKEILNSINNSKAEEKNQKINKIDILETELKEMNAKTNAEIKEIKEMNEKIAKTLKDLLLNQTIKKNEDETDS